MKPEIDWLQSRWSLPDAAAKSVEALLEAHALGSTACPLDPAIKDWGRAAAAPEKSDATPLVLVEHHGVAFLQTRWFFEAEKKIAARLVEWNSAPSIPVASENLARFFPDPGDQQKAADLALSRQLSVITGGPGTGKTYTLARILALLIEGGCDPRSIQLAAPTGKAADRMRQAVDEASMGLDGHLRSALCAAASTSKTLHSLLGHHPGKNSCAFHEGRRLPCDVLILDECSMIDTLLWQALLEALRDDCKLILLGDPNQLESVGRGSVFSVIAAAPALQAARQHLNRSRRFADRPAIAQLALAIENKNAAAALELLDSNPDASCPQGLYWSASTNLSGIFGSLPAFVSGALESAAYATTPAESLAALSSVRFLSAHRSALAGPRSIESAIESLLAEKNPGRRILNRPVIIDRNDPETGLRNGEVGVVHTAADDSRLVHFENREKGIPLSNLPAHSPAWGITIHRSQGSEYDNVIVLLPRDAGSPLATRELLYTAITRSKKNLFLFGPREVIARAIENPLERATLLSFQLESAS